MALVLANRVQESATANTTVSFTLTGAVSGFQSFAAVGNSNTTYYSATDATGNWEVGLGTYATSGPTLTRTAIYASSNSGSAVTFSGAVTVFLTYPSGRSVNLDASGNVSALGTVSSGTWQGSTVGVAYGGTGVTSSSGANSVVLRDANQNIQVNSIAQALTSTAAAGGTTTLTAASPHFQILTGTGAQTFKLPDATALTVGSIWVFDNDATGNLTVTDNANATVDVVAPGGYATVFLEANGTVAGTWGRFGMLPSEVNWGTNSLDLGGSTVVTNGIWQGTPVGSAYGGTGLTGFVGANNALYSTSSSALTAGTLPIAAGGTGQTTQQAAINALVGTQTANRVLRSDGTNMSLSQVALGTDVSGTLPVANGGTGQTSYTNGQLLIGNTTGNTLTKATLTAGSGISITNGSGSITIAASGGSVTCATPSVAGIVYGKTAVCGTCGCGQVALGRFAGNACQGAAAVAIGSSAGKTSQGCYAIAIGKQAGETCQPLSSIVISATPMGLNACGPFQFHVDPIRNLCSASGLNSLYYNTSTKEIVSVSGGGGGAATPTTLGTVYGRTNNICFCTGLFFQTALGYQAGNTNQAFGSVAVGRCAGYSNQGGGVAVGQCAGRTCQGNSAVSVGPSAGYNTQGSTAVAVGSNAGFGTQGMCAVAIGFYAGSCAQSSYSVAIGPNAGQGTQGPGAVAIGRGTANANQGANAIAIGECAAFMNQGANAIAIGYLAGGTCQSASSIVINATGATLSTGGTSRAYMAPIRNATGTTYLGYNSSTKEITYSAGAPSDATLKDNVQVIGCALNKTSQLRGVTFNWKQCGAPDIGVIAQEVEQVLPELVTLESDGLRSVKYENMVAVLIEAVKELKTRVEILEAKLQ